MSYTHITSNQRNELSVLLRAGLKQKEISQLLGKTSSAISQELTRNGVDNNIGYDARIAKMKTRERRIEANSRFRKIEKNKWLRNYVIRKVKQNWSPEQISGRLKIDYYNEKDKLIGKDSIYKYIYNERKDLAKYLRCQKGKYRRRYGTNLRIKQREEMKKVRIDQRPSIIGERERIGDWEGDTIRGGERNTAILTHVDRKSGYLLADKLERATAKNTREATVERFNRLPRYKRHTITYDNGTEFSEYELIGRFAKMMIYFAYPYHSWERGTNENTNGLLRQYFPKKSLFKNITQEQIEKAVKLINNRPRKRLNYMTPTEVFAKFN
jgi:transposase, IS30 family